MNISSYVNSGNIRSLYEFLHCWIEINNKYIDYFENEDNPWWYNERATLSTLAAAGWACNGVSLEEYSTEKGKHSDPWKGRCDFFLGMKNEFFACEAKQAWCAIGRQARNSIVKVQDGLRAACDDARKLTKQEGRRLGICFAVPYLPQRDKNHIDQQLTEWLKKINKLDYSSIAWFFPEKIRHLASERGQFHPGIAVLIKEVYRQT